MRHHQSKLLPFSLGARLKARLFEHEQQFKAQGFEMRGRQDRLQLSSDTRLRQATAHSNRVTRKPGRGSVSQRKQTEQH